MADIGFVDIKHPVTGGTASVPDFTLEAWEGEGWTRADNGSEESGLREPDREPSSSQQPAAKVADPNEE